MRAASVESLHPAIEDFYSRADSAVLQSAISREEGEFIQRVIREHDFRRTIEIGCAYGLSSLLICDAISKKPNAFHLIVDPFQSAHFGNRGVNSLRRAPFDCFELIEEPSEIVLPRLLQEGQAFDFGLIDGCHRFDHALLDFFYLNRLVRIGGVIVFDDVDMSAIRRAVRYVSNYPHLQFLGAVEFEGPKRRTLNSAKKIIGSLLRPMTAIFPRVTDEVFDDSLTRPDRIRPIDSSSMIAFLKTGEDRRSQIWYEDF